MRLGSLFDGSGGFPLAGLLNGIEPVWASEIEPYPMRVTAARLPQMKQLGSVLEVKGNEVEPVDIITFGSPCQDLSVAGAQKGIHEGERSNLFFEAVRIIKEMRKNDRATGRADDVRPRFAVWENVPGAYSSNKGQDFRAVLEALARVKDPYASIPMPEKGKWAKAGCIVGDGWSIAWRTYDAQFWGVPQRRKRIYLVADFGSERAGKILFEQESVCRDSAESGSQRERTAEDSEGSVGGSIKVGAFTGRNGAKCGSVGFAAEKAPTLRNTVTTDVVISLEGNTIDRSCKKNGKGYSENVAATLNTQDRHGIVYSVDNHPCGGRMGINESRKVQTLTSRMGTGGGNGPMVILSKDCTAVARGPRGVAYEANKKYIVRRLTPLECCRLQGFPDWWEEGVEGSDSARYKMWGNGIALPCAADVLGRIAKELRRA